MNDFLSFRKMITPLVIQALFWIGVAICVVMGLAVTVQGVTHPHDGGGGAVFTGC